MCIHLSIYMYPCLSFLSHLHTLRLFQPTNQLTNQPTDQLTNQLLIKSDNLAFSHLISLRLALTQVQ
eukprot:m.16992 g.16992  ORF g.16992 m.16992 type:complete len:67 (+) comp7285_c1_seq1:31-231(+)